MASPQDTQDLYNKLHADHQAINQKIAALEAKIDALIASLEPPDQSAPTSTGTSAETSVL